MSNAEAPHFARLEARNVAPLRLVKVDSVVLGTAEEGVNEITDFQVHDGRYYVLDGMSKSVRVFDKAGRLLSTIGREGRGPGELSEPMALAFAGGKMYVADPRRGKRLEVFEADGRFVEERPFDTPTVPVALAVAGDRVAAMGVLTVADPRHQEREALGVSTLDGRPVGRGCSIDPRYVESGKRDGMISHYDFGSVAARDDLIYCSQGISPVVQVMDRSGKALRQIRVAPPFYVAPRERRLTMNQKDIFDFLSSFTAHARFFPVDGGFVSSYSRFDPGQGEVRFHLFACRGEEQPKCGTVGDVRRPVYVTSLDTVYLEEEPQPNQPMQVGIYRLAGLEAR